MRSKHARRLLALSAGTLLAAATASAVLAAGQPVSEVTATLDRDLIEVTFAAAGFESGPLTGVATANLEVTLVCVNRGSQCPNAANKKKTLSSTLEARGEFAVSPSSQSTGGFFMSILGAVLASDCPRGQVATVSTVVVDDIQVTLTGPSGNSVTTFAEPRTLSDERFTCP